MKTIIVCVLALATVVACGGSGESIESGPSATEAALFGPTGAIGDECVVGDDCVSGFCDRTVPGGYCTEACEDTGDCPAGAHCEFGFCFATCTSQRDCRTAEFQCFEVAEELGVCSYDVGSMEPTAPNVGAPCRAVVECRAPEGLEAVCIAEVDLQGRPTGYPGGSCVAVGCTFDADCGEGNRCVPGTMPYCVPACTTDDECRPGYACEPSVGACTP